MTEDEIKNFVENELNKSGFSLQVAVERELEENFYVFREVPFLDRDDNKGRTIDITAHCWFPPIDDIKEKERYISSALQLLIECKQLPSHVWIFFKTNDNFNMWPKYFSITGNRQSDLVFQYIPLGLIDKIPVASGYKEIILDKSGSNGRDDNIYSAIMSVTKATSYKYDINSNHEKKMLYYAHDKKGLQKLFTIFQPIVVFRGRMYEAELEKDKFKLNPIKFVQLENRYLSPNYNEDEGYVHVVNIDGLAEYLKLLIDYYSQISAPLKKEQESLLKSYDNAISEVIKKEGAPLG